MTQPALRSCLTAAALAAGIATGAPQAAAHPHVFMEGGVDFVLGDGARLEALEVTWIFDAFETLYILAGAGHAPTAAGTLEDAARRDIVAQFSNWPDDDFAGSAHPSVDGEPIALDRPTDLDVDLVEGRLHMTFARGLIDPVNIAGRRVEVGFYEATYFYAFTATKQPIIRADGARCSAEIVPAAPDLQLVSLQSSLFALSREETPEIENVGELFADRIVLQCE